MSMSVEIQQKIRKASIQKRWTATLPNKSCDNAVIRVSRTKN